MGSAAAHEGVGGPRRTRRAIGIALAVIATTIGVHPVAAATQAPVISYPGPGAKITTNSISVSGTAAGNVVAVRVYEGATLLAETGPSSGYWAATITFADGSHSISAIGRDAAGTWSAHSATTTFSVDTVPPGRPVITSPADGQVATMTDVTIEGKAEPGSVVTVSADTGATFTTTTSSSGRWGRAHTFTETTHTITAIAVDAAGNESIASLPVRFTVDTRPPSVPTIFTPTDGAILAAATVHITGSAEPGSSVSIDDAGIIATVTASSAGAWNVTHTFAEGRHAISARATDVTGHMSAWSAPVEFTIDVSAPPAPAISTPRENSYVPSQVEIAGTAEPRSTVTVLHQGSILTEVETEDIGVWRTFIALADGPYTITARARDRAGNVSADSAPRTFMVDSLPPTVTIDAPQGEIFLPFDEVVFRGRAGDAVGIARVEIQLWDVAGRVIVKTTACTGCPGGRHVTWRSTYQPPRGRWIVKAYAFDGLGNRSGAATSEFIRL